VGPQLPSSQIELSTRGHAVTTQRHVRVVNFFFRCQLHLPAGYTLSVMHTMTTLNALDIKYCDVAMFGVTFLCDVYTIT